MDRRFISQNKYSFQTATAFDAAEAAKKTAEAELKRNENPKVVINKLYKHTNFENSFGVILLALDKRRPKQMNIRELLECFVEHRRDVVTRRTRFRLRKAEDRAHILEGFKIALRNLDDFVKIIRAATTATRPA